MTLRTIRIEVQPDREGGFTVARDRIVDAYFSDLIAANDYASSCAHRAQRAGLDVSLCILPAGRPADAA